MFIKISSNGQINQVEVKDLKSGSEILVESDGILEPAIALCQKECFNQPDIKTVNFVRIFTQSDFVVKKEIKQKARQYLDSAKAKTFRHGLEMKILDADLSFDEKKLTFYFSASLRVDFRSMVSDMVGDFGKIIRLQQVSSRDEAKHFGGFGKCGRPLCCATFLSNLDNVTMDLEEFGANINLKSPKLAGCCGKPMCCLIYEKDTDKETKVTK